MRRLSKLIIVFGSLLGLGCGVYYVIYAWVAAPFTITTVSPNRTYTVQLKEQVQSALPLFEGNSTHWIRMNVIKGSQTIIKDVGLYGGDKYDDRFAELFAEHNWISDSILWFSNRDFIPQSQHDEVTISNETNKVITYFRLVVEKNEMFLLFDIQPKPARILSVHPQTDRGRDYSWISGTGKTDDKDIAEYGVNFEVRDRYKNPAHYCIKIKDEGLTITSKEFEGYTYDKAGLKIKVAEATNCIAEQR